MQVYVSVYMYRSYQKLHNALNSQKINYVHVCTITIKITVTLNQGIENKAQHG